MKRQGSGDDSTIINKRHVDGSAASTNTSSTAHTTPELGPSLGGSTATLPPRHTKTTAAFVVDTPLKVRLANWLRNALPPPPPPPSADRDHRTESLPGERRGRRGGRAVAGDSVCDAICGGSSSMMAALLNPATRKVVAAGGSVRVAILGGFIPLCMDGVGGGTSAVHPLRTMPMNSPTAEQTQMDTNQELDTRADPNVPTGEATSTEVPPQSEVNDDGSDIENESRQDPAFIASGGSPKFSIFAQSNSIVMDVLAAQLLFSHVQATLTTHGSDTNLFAIGAIRSVLVLLAPIVVAYSIVGAICHLQLFGMVARSGRYIKLARMYTHSRSQIPEEDQQSPPIEPVEVSDVSTDECEDAVRTGLLSTNNSTSLPRKLKRLIRRQLSKKGPSSLKKMNPRAFMRSRLQGLKSRVLGGLRLAVFKGLYFVVAKDSAVDGDVSHRHITEMTMRPGVRKWVSEDWRDHIITVGAFLQGNASLGGSRPPPAAPLPTKSDLTMSIHQVNLDERDVSIESGTQRRFLVPTALAYVDLAHNWDVGSFPMGVLGTITFKKQATQ
jgi:hypothetical protein